ncbi:MAG: CPBP family intramembrane metalloprotease [Candidatus Eremiobacteraeota bacterium]|nr:CPBP family intramembrane metalloprotease [Candidatus Eremiobacteraeota bacterium]
MRSFVRAHPFLSYYVLAWIVAGLVTLIGGTWGAHSPAADPLSYWRFAKEHHMVLNMISIAWFGFTTGGPFVFLVFLFGGAPSISALMTSTIAWGKPGLIRLLSRFKPWRGGVTPRQALRVYGIMLAIYFAVHGLLLWHTAAFGTAEVKARVWDALGSSVFFAIPVLIVSLFADEGGSLEELGWRGFGLPYLQQRFRTPLVAAVVLGVLWWAWHLPREFPLLFSGHSWPGGEPFALGPWLLSETKFVSYTIVMTIVIAYCFNLTGGSVWPAIFVHGGTDAWGKTGAMDALWAQFKWPIAIPEAILLVFAALIVIFAGPRLGYRSDADGIDPEVEATTAAEPQPAYAR